MALFARVCELFALDPLIDEIGLVLGVDESELTPANAFVLEEHKLGVALSAGPQLFREARTRFHELNPLLARTTVCSDTPAAALLAAQLVDCTRAVLLISADFYTAWNTRKELVRRGRLDALAETRFCDLVFTLHAKSIDTWAYRRWLATQLLSGRSGDASAGASVDADASRVPALAPLTGDARRDFCARQLELCSLLAEQKPRNYHAWSFRHWVVSQLPQDALELELETMRRWCTSHITDHSGWNHRQHVVNVLARCIEPRELAVTAQHASVRALVVTEHAFVSALMAAYPTHEALWCHRRFVVQLAMRELCSNGESLKAAGGAADDDVAQLSRALNVLTSKVTTGAGTEQIEAGASLALAWQAIETSLRALAGSSDAASGQVQLLLAVAHEIDIAWRVGNRFSQRFALWCVERVRRQQQQQPPSRTSKPATLSAHWSSLASALRLRLRSADPLLEHLWRDDSQ